MKHVSPLRYPGGKTGLAKFLSEVITENKLRDCIYFEPYAGGAGAALTLLAEDFVSEVYLNDADIRIYAFWRAVLDDSERFINKIYETPLTIEEWRKQHEICTDPSQYSFFDIGFAAFYMNRCNRSGILTGSGPIGGYEQKGKWRMDVRFNRETLAGRILELDKKREQIHIFNRDAVDFLKEKLQIVQGKYQGFIYLDPPYVGKGQRLYMNSYEEKDHKILAKYILAQQTLPWLMSYDDVDLVRKLYSKCKISLLPVRYALQSKRSAQELIISPKHIVLPPVSHMDKNKDALRKVA